RRVAAMARAHQRWRRDLNPRTVLAVSRFQGECIRPLCHATAVKGTVSRLVTGAVGRPTTDSATMRASDPAQPGGWAVRPQPGADPAAVLPHRGDLRA